MPNSIRTTSNTTTLANQAPEGLDDGLSIVQANQRKVIDLTSPNDTDVTIISSHDLSNLACDISGAAGALHDVGQLLALIHYDKIQAHTAEALARLAHDATDTWVSLLYEKLERINDTLALTGYGKEGNQ